MSHQVKFIHLICTDPRIQKIYHNYLLAKGLFGKFDTIEHENPILDFLDERKLPGMIERIKAYRQLHGASKIVLFDHFDCGAYKLSGYKFKSEEAELDQHKQNNRLAVEIIKKYFPDMEIEVRYIRIKEDGSCEWYPKLNFSQKAALFLGRVWHSFLMLFEKN